MFDAILACIVHNILLFINCSEEKEQACDISDFAGNETYPVRSENVNFGPFVDGLLCNEKIGYDNFTPE